MKSYVIVYLRGGWFYDMVHFLPFPACSVRTGLRQLRERRAFVSVSVHSFPVAG